MKKNIATILLIFVLIFCLTATAYADNTGYALFNSKGKMESHFNVAEVFAGMQPGDTADYTVTITNQHAQTTRWYMSNTVLDSLEEQIVGTLDNITGRKQYATIRGGAYSYTLTYRGPSATKDTVIFSNDTTQGLWVGGDNRPNDEENRIGLREATNNLEDWFYLDTLNSGESGTVKLTVRLEGETQGNVYQNTQADIQMNFAVELAGGNNSNRSAVKTGDENNLTPYYIAMVITGLIFLYLALDALTDRMYKKGRR